MVLFCSFILTKFQRSEAVHSSALLMAPILLPPFPAKYQLRSHVPDLDCLVGIPSGRATDEEPLSSSVVNEFLRYELDTPILNELYPHLWFVGKKAGDRIDALHKQRIQGRNIVLAEDPALHLACDFYTVYLKPVPQCLLNHAFWEKYLLPSKLEYLSDQQSVDTHSNLHICRTALGYLRSYSLLIQHESDYAIAQRTEVIPKDISYHDFRRFILSFRHIPDEFVSPRYHYGQVCVNRLNYAVRLWQPSSKRGMMFYGYHEHSWLIGGYLKRCGTPVLFLFAAFSVMLSAMQVALAALDRDTWPAFVTASWAFSIAVPILIVVLAAGCTLGVLCSLLAQGQFPFRMGRRETVKESRLVSA